MMFRYPDQPVSAYDDDWEDLPMSGPWAKWFGGVALPLALFAYGIVRIVTRQGAMGIDFSLGTATPRLVLVGGAAVAFGAAMVGLALFLHCHYFWGNIYHLSAFAVLGKIAGLLGLIAGLGYLIVRIGVLG